MAIIEEEYGYNSKKGIIIPTLSMLQQEMLSDLENEIGSVNDEEDGAFSTQSNIVAERHLNIWYIMAALFSNMDAATAEGIGLDSRAVDKGLSRLKATRTIAKAQLGAINNTQILKGSEISGRNVDSNFRLQSDVIINNNECAAIVLSLSNDELATYTIIVNSISFSYNKQEDDRVFEILENIALLIQNAGLNVSASTNSEDEITLFSTNESNFSCYINDTENSFIIERVFKRGTFEAINKGQINAPARSLTNIVTPISGWVSVINETGKTGRELETDTEFRTRILSSGQIIGAATLGAMRARLLNLEGVTAVKITENRTNETVDDLPPKSYRILILGGDDQDIANMIWLIRPAGIEMIGNTSVQIFDDESNLQYVKFSRAENLYIYVKVQILGKDLNYPVTGEEAIKENILKQLQKLTVGQDVIYQSLYASVYSVPGVTNADIYISSSNDLSSPPSEGSYQSENIIMSAGSAANIDLSRIIVEVVA